jgi:integration host factor subunit alpha
MARINFLKNTITRQDLREVVYKSISLISRDDARRIVDETIEEICSTLAAGEMVKLKNFGTFKVRKKPQRLGRNPKTGIEAKITPRRVVTYKPSPRIIKALNEPHS